MVSSSSHESDELEPQANRDSLMVKDIFQKYVAEIAREYPQFAFSSSQAGIILSKELQSTVNGSQVSAERLII